MRGVWGEGGGRWAWLAVGGKDQDERQLLLRQAANQDGDAWCRGCSRMQPGARRYGIGPLATALRLAAKNACLHAASSLTIREGVQQGQHVREGRCSSMGDGRVKGAGPSGGLFDREMHPAPLSSSTCNVLCGMGVSCPGKGWGMLLDPAGLSVDHHAGIERHASSSASPPMIFSLTSGPFSLTAANCMRLLLLPPCHGARRCRHRCFNAWRVVAGVSRQWLLPQCCSSDAMVQGSRSGAALN